MISDLEFPEEFHWGTGVSAQQTEGNHLAGGRGLSIWDDYFLNRQSNWINWDTSPLNACNFYEKFSKDIDILKQLGIKNFRFSISWSRILPSGTGVINAAGVSFYNRLIDNLLEHGITPWITLYHWDLPQKLQQKGGWTNRDIVYQFQEFTSICVKTFGDRVKNWMILNEPSVFTGAGYFLGIHPPGVKGLSSFLKAAHHACICVAEGAKIVKELCESSHVGSTYSFTYIEPHSILSRHQNASDRVHGVINRFFLEPALGLGYPTNDYPFLKSIEKYFMAGDDNLLAAPLDFIGAQTYTREVVKFSPFTPYLWAKRIKPSNRSSKLTAMGWENYPDALSHILKWLGTYNQIKSIIITESGIALHDKLEKNKIDDHERILFLEKSIEHVHSALIDGIPVNGYFTWSFLDNLEWAEGFAPRFGMVYVDFKTQQRVLKESAYFYQQFLRKNTLVKRSQKSN